MLTSCKVCVVGIVSFCLQFAVISTVWLQYLRGFVNWKVISTADCGSQPSLQILICGYGLPGGDGLDGEVCWLIVQASRRCWLA
eukprot:scaffold155404_cov37-Prasinocladus_malaysianus.AAC.2